MSGESTVEEHDLPRETRTFDLNQPLLFSIDGVVHRAMDRLCSRIEVMWARRYPSGGRVEEDYGERLRRLEGRLDDDYEPDIHIHNTGKPGPPRWVNKLILGVAVTLMAGAITTTATVVVTVASIRTRIEDYITSNDKRLDRDERQIDDTQRRLDRGAASP